MLELLSNHGISISGYKQEKIYDVVVPFSGGKDSQTCLKLAINSFPKEKVLALFCDTRFEHPITYKHVVDTCKKYGVDLVTLNSCSVLEVCTKYKRFPGGKSRHCTDELKIRPSKYFYKYLSLKQNSSFQVWLGMRSDESKEREARYKGKISSEIYAPHEILDMFPKYLFNQGVTFRLPIIDWATDEVYEYLGGDENILYSHGFERVGCFPCLAAGDAHKMLAFYFDDVGSKHFQIAEQISEVSGRPVFTTKKYMNQGPGCAFCCI